MSDVASFAGSLQIYERNFHSYLILDEEHFVKVVQFFQNRSSIVPTNEEGAHDPGQSGAGRKL